MPGVDHDGEDRRYGVIIGAMKAATTTLFDALTSHDGIAVPRLKEPQFFARDDRYAEGAAWYRDLWPADVPDGAVFMEASTHYTWRDRYPETVDRIARFPGRFRFVYIVRDPIARIESHYHHALAHRWVVAERPIDEVAFDDRMLGPSRYAWQLDAYADRFGADQVLVLRFDDVVADLTAAVHRACEHWGLPTDDLGPVAPRHENSRDAKVASTRFNALRRVPGAKLAARIVPDRLYYAIGRGVAATESTPTTLSPSVRRRVLDALHDDLERLEREWNIPVQEWLTDEPDAATGTS